MSLKRYVQIRTFTLADALTSLSLVLGWIAMTLVFRGHFFSAIIWNASALYLDTLDGYVARIRNRQSSFGARFDSFVDIINYLLFPLTLYFFGHPEQTGIITIGGALILLFGILRLVGWSGESGKEAGKKADFIGFPVIHAFFMVMIIFWVERLAAIDLSLLFLFLAALVSFLMISTVPVKKSRRNYMVFIGMTAANLTLSIWQMTR